MPKKFKSFEHFLKPDYKFNNKLITKFINCMMWDGQKAICTQIFYQALDEVGKKVKDTPPVDIFIKALERVKPQLEVRSRRIGGATYQVPVTVPGKRQMSLAIRWILQTTRKKKGKSMYLKLAAEFIAASRGEGDAMLTRQNIHKMAEANKAFAHFAY